LAAQQPVPSGNTMSNARKLKWAAIAGGFVIDD
jgi:hypothetical protein